MDYPSRIMIVEDNVLLLLDLADSLAARGVEPLAFTTADSAAAEIETLGVDALITDMELPGAMSGLDLARECATRRPGMPIVIVSAGVRPQASEMPRGATFVPKPYGIEQVLRPLRSRTGARRAA